MTYYEIISEILTRVNDPEGDTYLDRAKQLMFEGINMIASKGDYIEEDIPGMLRNALEFLHDFYLSWAPPEDSTWNNGQVLKILGITSHIRSADHGYPVYRYKKIDGEYLNKMHLDSEYEPLSNEVFYIINEVAGNYLDVDTTSEAVDLHGTYPTGISFHPGSRVTSGAGVLIKIKYIRSPYPPAWFYGTSASDSTDVSGYLSLPYIYRVIDYAALKINVEISGEA